MAWQKKNTEEHKEMVDLRTGMHLIPLIEPNSGAEHRLQIVIGHDACAACGHVKPKTNTDEIDPKQHIKQEMTALEQSHANQRAYAKKHGVPVLGADGKVRPAR